MAEFDKEIDDLLEGFKPEEAASEETVAGETSEVEAEGEANEETPPEDEGETPEGEEAPEGEEEEEEEETPAAETPEGEGDEEEQTEEAEEAEELTEREKTLLARIEELEGKGQTPQQEEEALEEAESFSGSFLPEDADVEEILDSREKLDQLLVAVYNQAVKDAAVRSRETTLQSLPQIVMQQVAHQTHVRKATEEFYEEHPQLTVARKTVGSLANEVAAEHPDWTLDKVLDETAKRSYKALGLKKVAVTSRKGGSDKNKPALARPTGARKRTPADGRSGLQQEIDGLID